MQAVPNRLRQGRARVKKHAHFAQQIAAQHIVGVHGVGYRFQACGHIEIHRGRYLAQVAQCFVHEGGHRFAVVDINRAAVVEREPDVVVTAESVVPRQPIHQHRRRLGQHRHGLQHLLLVGAPHAVRVDHAFGHIGRARGEQKFHHRVRPGGLHGDVYRWGVGRFQQVGKTRVCSAFNVAVAQHDFYIFRHTGFHRCAVAVGVHGHHHAGRERAHDVFEFVVVFADGGIRGRHRAMRDAHHHASQRHHGVFQAVFAEDQHGFVYAQTSVQQGLTYAPGCCQRLRIRQVFPVAGAAVAQAFATRHISTLWRDARPMQ